MRKADKQLINFLEQMNSMIKNNNRKNNEFYYSSVYDFILKEGKTYKSQKLTKQEKDIVKNAIMVLGFKPQYKQCYYNAQLLAISDRTNTIKYVEGQAQNLIPTSHGWNEINGKIIDVTYKHNDKIILGNIPENSGYIGIVVDTEIIRRKILNTGYSNPIIEDWENHFPLLQKKYSI